MSTLIEWLMEPRAPEIDGFERPTWQTQAACRGQPPDVFFPPTHGSYVQAAALCAVCPVRAECLTYALSRPEPLGYWGGTTENERRRMRRSAARLATWDGRADRCTTLRSATARP